MATTFCLYINFLLAYICHVFSISVFYVFYEQYLNIWPDALQSLGLSLTTIFLATFFLTGFDVISSALVLGTVTLIVINMGGLMWMWNISLNAVSLVNLVVVSISEVNTDWQEVQLLCTPFPISSFYSLLVLELNLYRILYEHLVKLQDPIRYDRLSR